LKRISRIVSGDSWFAIMGSAKNTTRRPTRNSASDTVRMLSVSLQWILELLAFRVGEYLWKTMTGPQKPPRRFSNCNFRLFREKSTYFMS
jgi:hypothetical protein